MPCAKAKRGYNRLSGLLILILFMLLSSVATAQLPLDPKAGTSPKVEMVWPEVVGDTYQIFYSATHDNSVWTPKRQISDSDALNLAPVIGSGSSGVTWVVWSIVEGVNSKLVYCFYNGEEWSQPKLMSPQLSSNTGPSIIIDGQDIPWVVWSGFDGTDDDIYFSTWDGSGWGRPERIHADNDVPDLLPRIVLSGEDRLSVYWNGFADDSYQLFISTWNEGRWTEKKPVDRKAYRATLRAESSGMFAIPDFVPEPEKAAVHMRMAAGASISIPMREIK